MLFFHWSYASFLTFRAPHFVILRRILTVYGRPLVWKVGLVRERLSAGFVLAMKSRESGKFLPQTERRKELLKEKIRDWNQLNHV